MGRKSVMVVEDDSEIRETLCQVLEDEGYAVLDFRNGREALEHLKAAVGQAGPPGLILLDLMMPIMNGWQFRAAQLEDPALAHIPVVVLTAERMAPKAHNTLPGVARLRKPVELDDLLHAVQQFC